MYHKLMIVCLALLFVATPLVQGQENDNPTIAFLRFGRNPIETIVHAAFVNTLHSYGFITLDELGDRADQRLIPGEIEGTHLENLNFHYFSAGYDFAALNTIVDAAMDTEPDIVVAVEELTALSVVNATATMEDPPVVLFAAVPNPYRAGLAEASCIKPAHVTGTRSDLSYDQILPMYLAQNPDLQTVGVIFYSNENSSREASELITAAGEAMGWQVITTAVASIPDLVPATDGLLSKGVQAIIVPNNSFLLAGLPVVTSAAGEFGIPVFSVGMDGAMSPTGSMVGISFNGWTNQGISIGLVAAAWLNGDIDIADMGISSHEPILGYTINHDFAEAWGIELPPELLEAADMSLFTERAEFRSERAALLWQRMFEILPLDVRKDADREFIDSIRCTPEMIAEQQAELDAES